MKRLIGFSLLAAVAVYVLVPVIGVSQPRGNAADDWCSENRVRRDAERYCEVREFRLDASELIVVDSGSNGGIEVTGWDRNEIELRAKVEAWSSREDPESIVAAIEISTDAADIRADGPRSTGGYRDGGWAVSFALMVPAESNLSLDATNGGIEITGVTGELDFSTTNGGLRLARVGGDVHGRTTNGGIDVELDAPEWQGAGLELTTTNGGVSLEVPAEFRADLSASTVNGGIRADLPIVVEGRINRRNVEAELNGGGAPIRLATVNGGIAVRER